MAKEKKDSEDREKVAWAVMRHVRIAPQKARLMLNLIKGRQVEPALQILEFSPRKGARLIAKVLRSAIMNAKERAGADVDRLWITGGSVDMGRTIKRFMPRARGSANVILKRSSHIRVQLGER